MLQYPAAKMRLAELWPLKYSNGKLRGGNIPSNSPVLSQLIFIQDARRPASIMIIWLVPQTLSMAFKFTSLRLEMHFTQESSMLLTPDDLLDEVKQ